jgi:hypothetical protein
MKSQQLGNNPFAPDHAALDGFEEATWKAKERIAKIESEYVEAIENRARPAKSDRLRRSNRSKSIAIEDATSPYPPSIGWDLSTWRSQS